MKPYNVASVVQSALPGIIDIPDAVVRLAVRWPSLTRDPELLVAFRDKVRAGDVCLTDSEVLDLACEHGREGNRVGIPWAWDETHRQVSRERGAAVHPVTRVRESLSDIAADLRDIERELRKARLTNFANRVGARAQRIENTEEKLGGGK